MTVPESSTQILSWMREGEARFLRQLDGLTADEIRADSALPGWTRSHVAAHVARNAEAVSRLLSWARTGTETQMYPDMESRNRDIETTAGQDADAVRTDVQRTSAKFAADVEGLPAEAWSARVQTFSGREVPATFVIWMRVREVWLHLVDLGAGESLDAWPSELVDALLDEVTATMSGRADAPCILLRATDRDRDWEIGIDSKESSVQLVSGTAADLLAYLTGRSTGQGLATEGPLPSPPPWM